MDRVEGKGVGRDSDKLRLSRRKEKEKKKEKGKKRGECFGKVEEKLVLACVYLFTATTNTGSSETCSNV